VNVRDRPLASISFLRLARRAPRRLVIIDWSRLFSRLATRHGGRHEPSGSLLAQRSFLVGFTTALAEAVKTKQVGYLV